MEPGLREFIEGMPKTELHLHIEGTLEPDLMMKLAERNGLPLPYEGNVGKAIEARKFNNLQEFLNLYYEGMDLLRTEQDFYDLTMAYLEKAASQNVNHAEIFFDPQAHMGRGIAFETVIDGISRALEDGEKKFGISSKLIMCFLRHLSEEEALEALEEARPYLEKIDGFGLDSSEKDHPPSGFEHVFAKAQEIPGKFVVAHAGEEGPASYVQQALDKLHVSRVDHGNHVMDVVRGTDTSEADPGLIDRLAENKIGLTMCPISNLRLNVLQDLRQHPAKELLDYGVKVTVNSDDPAYFRTDDGKEGGYITENFLALAEALGLTRKDIIKMARNAIEISSLTPDEKVQKHRKLTLYDIKTKAAEEQSPDKHAMG